MKTHKFTIFASGVDVENPNIADAGCNDAIISIQKGLIVLEFDREANGFGYGICFGYAILSACAAVKATGAQIERIEPGHIGSGPPLKIRKIRPEDDYSSIDDEYFSIVLSGVLSGDCDFLIKLGLSLEEAVCEFVRILIINN